MRSFLFFSVFCFKALAVFILIFPLFELKAEEAETPYKCLQMPTARHMQRADVWYVDPPAKPRAILVLCPGANGNGLSLIRQVAWRDFADRHNLALAGIHFESPIDLLSQCQGYYQASQGSGDLLLQAIQSICGERVPILFFGFSGGAHYITRFITWNPGQVLAWGAAGAGVLEQPSGGNLPPGIMACGADDTRLGGALTFFKQGRAQGNPWIWVEMPKVGHSFTPEFEEFVRAYFTVQLNDPTTSGLWVDIDRLTELTADEAQRHPALSGWIPDRSIIELWLKCHASTMEISQKYQ